MQEIGPDDQYDRFQNEDHNPAILVTLMRIYDIVTIIALNANEELTEFALSEHEAGRIVNSLPALDLRRSDD